MKKALVLIVALMASLVPATSAVTAPVVKFISPSPLRTGQVPELSSKGGRPVHLVAWGREFPAGALIEFEVRAVATTPPTFNTTTVDGTLIDANTVEGFFVIPDDWADGQYQVRVGVFTSDGQDEVASATQNVTVNDNDLPPPAQAENVELSQPENGGTVGFFTPPEGRPNTLVQATASAGAEQVRALYTKSAPGTDPTWIQCGSGAVGEGGFTTVRCTLATGDAPGSVTAIAAVANMTPSPAPADPSADDGMDAHTVSVYTSQPASVAVTPESIRQELSRCQLFTASVFDQFSRPLAAVNVDVHAAGPDDQLTFATDDTSPLTARTDDYQAPNDNHVSEKPTITCSDRQPTEDDFQGQHRSIGSPDRMHIESVAGTDNSGSFVFALMSRSLGGTQIAAWADVNDDDAQSLSEASGAASLGWGQDPPPPRTEVFLDPDGPTAELGDCQTMTLVVREAGAAKIGANVDVHIQGPDTAVQFCSPAGSTPRRDPDAGGHVAGVHPEGEPKHIEGETDTTGRFVFGVTSSTEGTTEVLGWSDDNGDDVFQTSEPNAPAEISWQPEGERSISLSSSRGAVARGRRVRLFGEITGGNTCTGGQTVKLKARVPGANFKTIAQRTTDPEGDYAFRVRVRKTKDYRAVAPQSGPCQLAKSRIVRVRAKG